jgi:hypothetical protein
MKSFFLEALGPFVTSFGLVAIALGLVAVLRSRGDRMDHHSVSSRLASALGYLGIAGIAFVSLHFVWRMLAASYEGSHAPALLGGAMGVLLAALGFARPAFQRSRAFSEDSTETVK